jgi:hypothetical protein
LTIESKLSAAAAGSVDISWEAGDDDHEEEEGAGTGKMATIGLSKVFILDKYFTELQKFWETERKVQGNNTTHHQPPFESCLYCKDIVKHVSW